MVERVLGKDEVIGSIPINGSNILKDLAVSPDPVRSYCGLYFGRFRPVSLYPYYRPLQTVHDLACMFPVSVLFVLRVDLGRAELRMADRLLSFERVSTYLLPPRNVDAAEAAESEPGE